jgi:predicted GNAT family acetyltransferase
MNGDTVGKINLRIIDETGAEPVEKGFIVASADPRELDTFRIQNVELNEEMRGKGIGKAMYIRVGEEAREAGFTKIASEPDPSPDAQRVWESLGGVKQEQQYRSDPMYVLDLENLPARQADEATPTPREDVDVIQLTPEDRYRKALQLTSEQRQKVAAAIQAGDRDKALELIDFNENTIDWDSLGDEAGDIAALMNTFTEVLEDVMSGVRGSGVQSNATTARRADRLGNSAEGVTRVFNDVTDDGGLSARILASDRAHLASARRLVRLAKVAKETGAPVDIQKFHRQVELHAAIHAESKGARKEVGRALQAMSIMKSATEESFKEFDDIIRHMGGHGQNTDKLLQKFIDADSLGQINVEVTRTAGRKLMDIISEVAINGLLSSPKTHLVNISSNSLQVGLGNIERWVAAGIGEGYKLFKNSADVQTFRDAMAYTQGTIDGIHRGRKLAWQAMKERRPISDPRQRIEFDSRKAIYKSTDGLTGAELRGAQAINALGEVIRVPGTALIVEDEFFKATSEWAARRSIAYRQLLEMADEANISPNRRQRWIAERIDETAENLNEAQRYKAKEHARFQTFQETPQTKGGDLTERVLNSHPLFKLVVAPFVRTPLNILRQVFVDRTPLSLAMRETREKIMRGGPEAQVELAKMTIGTSMMIAGYELAEAGWITGGGETWWNTERLDGVQPYSFYVGDGNWVQYNRLDPVGSWLAMAADFQYLSKAYYDSEDPETASKITTALSGGIYAISRNALNKTWMQSVNDILDALMKEQGPAAQKGRIDALVAGQLRKLIPFSSAINAANQVVDPIAKEAVTISERLQRGLPSQSQLPPRRDYLGRVVTVDKAPLYWLNPFTISPESKDPLDQELSRLAYTYQPIPKRMDGVQLTSQQRSDFLKLIGQTKYPQFNNRTLEEHMRWWISTPQYQNASETDFDVGGKEAQLKALYSAARQLAKQRLFEEHPELGEKVNAIRLRAAQKKRSIDPT